MAFLPGFLVILDSLKKEYKDCEIPNVKENTTAQSVLDNLNISVIYVVSLAQASEAVSHLLKQSCLLGLDIETAPLPELVEDKRAGLEPRKSRIRLIQIFDGNNKVYVFDMFQLSFSVLDKLWNKPFVAHNAVFEMQHLTYAGCKLNKLGCSLLVDRVLNGKRLDLSPNLGLSKKAGLKDLSKELLGLDISKEQQKSDWAVSDLSDEQLAYAGLDAVLTSKIFSIQYPLMKEQNLIKAYELLRNAQQPIVDMMLAGIQFDVASHKAYIEQWKEEAEQLEEKLLRELGTVLNLRSGKQLIAWIKENLSDEDLEGWQLTEKGALSTSTPTLKNKTDLHKTFPNIIQYRFLSKRLSSFGENFYTFIDTDLERLYGGFTLGTTATGRLSSVKPNLQNLPRGDYRKLFIAKKGYSLICSDYGQQEIRIASILSQDRALLSVFEKGLDIHKQTASALLDVSEDKLTKNDRQLAKAVNFGLLYGQSAKGLVVYAKNSYGVGLTLEEAEKHRQKFFSVYKGLRKWQRKTADIAKIRGKVETIGGRVRNFSREARGYRYTISLNHPVQGAGAEIMLKALHRVTGFTCEDCRLVNSVHDELLFEVSNSEAERYLKLIEKEMVNAFLDVFPNSEPYLTGLIEGHIGKNWQEAK